MHPNLHLLVDEDEVSHAVTRDLNNIFGSDPKHLSRVSALVEELIQARDHLQHTLQFASSEGPDKITRAIKGAERALGESERLLRESDQVRDQVKAHCEKVDPLMEQVGPGVRAVGELERVERYQLVLDMIEECSQEVGTALHIGAEGQALLAHSKLVDTAKLVVGSQCCHIVRFLMATLRHWNKALLHRFTGEFEGVLKSMKWPLAGGQLPASPDTLQRLCTLTHYLLQLTLPEELVLEEEEQTATTPSHPFLVTFDPLLLPIQLLVNPLQVRFLYHFSGGRATNSRSHPEWYFVQLLKWIGGHDTFLAHRIQPVLDRCGRGDVSAKVEFMRGLVRLAAIKVTSDLPHLQEDDDLFCATIQEVLHFHRELSEVHGYPRSQPSILGVLTDPRVFPRWLALERKFALEVMDELVSSDGAWEVEEWGGGAGGGGGGGGGGGARCGEQVILLLQGITDRYKQLLQPGHRLQFLELQLDLLDDFRVRLLQVMKGERQEPLTSHYPAILNTTHHLSATLADWADLPFFIEMQYYQESFRKALAATTTPSHLPSSPAKDRTDEELPPPLTSTPSSSPLPPPSTTSVPPTPEHLKFEATPPSITQLGEVSGSVFDTTRSLYTHIEGEMVNTLATFVFSEVRARSLPYRRDGWHKSGKGYSKVKVLEVSPSICPLLEVVARHLHTLRDCLATPLFHTLWAQVAETLNKYIFEELVLETRFSEAGAAQFQFDMTRALFPIFGEFTQKPENYFKLIKESAILLTLPRPTVILLQDTLQAADSVMSPHRALAEHGVTLLSPQEAAAVLNARIYDE